MRIKLFSNYLPLLCLTACVWVSCSQNREKKSGKKDHTPVMRLTTTTIEVPQSYSGCTSRTVRRGETESGRVRGGRPCR